MKRLDVWKFQRGEYPQPKTLGGGWSGWITRITTYNLFTVAPCLVKRRVKQLSCVI